MKEQITKVIDSNEILDVALGSTDFQTAVKQLETKLAETPVFDSCSIDLEECVGAYFSNYGFSIVATNGVIEAIFFYGHHILDELIKKPFQGKLPCGVNFEMSKEDIISFLGKPHFTGGDCPSSIDRNEYLPGWVKYQMDNYYLHFKFTKDQSKIDKVTVMPLSVKIG